MEQELCQSSTSVGNTESVDRDHHHHHHQQQQRQSQVAVLPAKSAKKSGRTTCQQAILLAMIYYCFEDFCQYIFWSTLLCIIGFYDHGSYLKDKVKAMRKHAEERRSRERPVQLQQNSDLPCGMKLFFNLGHPPKLHGRRVSRAPSAQIYAILEIPENDGKETVPSVR